MKKRSLPAAVVGLALLAACSCYLAALSLQAPVGRHQTACRAAGAAPGAAECRLAPREAGLVNTMMAERQRRARDARIILVLQSGVLGLAAYFFSWQAALNGQLTAARERLASQLRQAALELERATALRRAETAARTRAEKALQVSAGMRRSLLAHRESITEHERKRIAREVHDGLGQDLYALRMEIARLHLRSDKRHPRLHARVGQVLRLVDELMASVRAIIEDLRPEALDLGLDSAIRWQAAKFQRTAKACRVELKLERVALGEERATALFRILQEALANIRRHAKATLVQVELTLSGGTLCMCVKDNGRGFRPNTRAKHGSFGLIGISERVKALDGQVEIVSAPGRGTSLAVSIPIQPPGRAGKPATSA
jgi:signal transduction histidine kinase